MKYIAAIIMVAAAFAANAEVLPNPQLTPGAVRTVDVATLVGALGGGS